MATNPIVTTGNLTSYQGGDAQSLIDQATALVRRYCRWHVTPNIIETVTLDGSGNATQILPSLNVTAVTSVAYDGTTLTTDDYTWSPDGVIEYLAIGPYFSGVNRWVTGLGKVTVVFTHGFAEAPDVAAVIMAVASRAQASPNGVVRSQAGPFSETYSQFGFNQAGGMVLLDAEKLILDAYRLAPRP